MIPKWSATITEKGFRVDLKQQFRDYLETLPEKVVVVIAPIKSQRSTNQNNYYFGVLVEQLHRETGYSFDEMHEVLKAKYLSREVEFKGKKYTVVRSTTSLNTKEMEDYLQKIREWASSKMECYIPEPNECSYE